MAYDGGLCVYSRQVHRVTDGHIQKKNKSHNVSVHITHNIWPMCTTYSTTPYRSHSRNFSYFFEVHERNTDSVFFGFYTWSWLGWWSPSNSPADSLNCYQIIFVVVVVVLQAVFHCVASSAGFGLVGGRKTLLFFATCSNIRISLKIEGLDYAKQNYKSMQMEDHEIILTIYRRTESGMAAYIERLSLEHCHCHAAVYFHSNGRTFTDWHSSRIEIVWSFFLNHFFLSLFFTSMALHLINSVGKGKLIKSTLRQFNKSLSVNVRRQFSTSFTIDYTPNQVH